MGVTRKFGRQITSRDMASDAYESVKRNASGSVQFTAVGTKKGTASTSLTGLTASNTSLASLKTSRAAFSKVKLVVSTSGTPTKGVMKVKRGTATPASLTGLTTTKTTTVSTKTFTSSPATWSLSLTTVGGGSVSVKTWSQSREARR